MTNSEANKPDTLLSLSIDVAGSTAAKQAIQSFQSQYGTHEQQFEAYLKMACNIEDAFYTALRSAKVIALQDLFVVKHIGDEIWCVVPLVSAQRARSQAVIHDVLTALASMLSRTGAMYFSITETPEEPHFDASEDTEFTTIELGAKVTVDLLSSVTEFTNFRGEFLGRRYMQRTLDQNLAAETAHLLQQLNFGTTQSEGTHVRVATRMDYVGLDVDRFFRLTQHATPGLILAGDSVCRYLELTELSSEQHPVATYFVPVGDRALYEAHPAAKPMSSQSAFWWTIANKPILLKGILDAYASRYLFQPHIPSLPGNVRHSGYKGVYAKTVEFLRTEGMLPGPA